MRTFGIPRVVLSVGLFVGLQGCGAGDNALSGNRDGGGAEVSIIVPPEATPTDAPGHEGGGRDASKPAPYPAPHAAPPRAIDYGGPVLNAPQIVPVFFQDDAFEGQVEAFLKELGPSAYWTGATSEYGVGSLTVAPSIVVTDSPPTAITDAEVEVWLSKYLDGSHPEWPAVTPNNIYMVFYPSSTTITLGTFGASCSGFGGYHYEGSTRLPPDGGAGDGGDAGLDAASGEGGAAFEGGADAGGAHFTYAVIPRCAMFGGLTGIDTVTSAVSHETVEASTDPLNRTHTAYSGVDDNHIVWEIAPGGEVGDLCAYEPQSFQRLVGTFMVQRIWSNTAAAAGQDPCVPAVPKTPSPVYFNTAPDLKDHVTLTYEHVPYSTLGVKLPVGQSTTLTLRFFSSEPTDPWTVYLEDTSSAFGGTELLQFTPSQVTGSNGDVVTVNMTAVAAGAYGGSEMVLVSYRPPDETVLQYWFGFVEN
jgi:hypothetical protein